MLLLLGGACGSDGGDTKLDASREAGKAICNRYIECNVEVAPMAVGPLLEAYGPDGTCWDTTSLKQIGQCRLACEAALEQLGEAFPKSSACGECSERSHCEDPDLPACDLDVNECVECLEASDCADESRPACELAGHTCVECSGHQDCTGEARPFCADNMVCVECLGDKECGLAALCESNKCVPLPKICEPGDGRCFGNRLDICDEFGVRWLSTPCSSSESCDAAAAECVPKTQVCKPNSKFCEFTPQHGRADVRTCSADGFSSKMTTNCTSMGRTCHQGSCLVTEYGPCFGGLNDCLSGDDCFTIEPPPGNGEATFVCAPACADGACPAPLPPGAPGVEACEAMTCLLGCDPADEAACPPGMTCSPAASGGAYCGWVT